MKLIRRRQCIDAVILQANVFAKVNKNRRFIFGQIMSCDTSVAATPRIQNQRTAHVTASAACLTANCIFRPSAHWARLAVEVHGWRWLAVGVSLVAVD